MTVKRKRAAKKVQKQAPVKKKSEKKKPSKKKPSFKISNGHGELMYVLTLLIFALANFLVAFALVPVFILSNRIEIFFVVAFFGLFFGYVFNYLITKIENLEQKHKIALVLFIPLVSIADFIITARVSGTLSSALGVGVSQDPYIVAAVYVIGLILPYIYFNIGRK